MKGQDPRVCPPGTPILNLGAGDKILAGAGAVNHDRTRHRPEISVAHDLNLLPWPWLDDSFDLILANAVLEHLTLDLVGSLNECWRLLRPGGQLRVKVPFWQHDNAYADPTHRWHCSMRTWDYFDPATKLGSEYGFYTTRKWKIVKPAQLNEAGSSVIATLQVRK